MKLYTRVRDTFPDWTGRQCSEYTAGVKGFSLGVEIEGDEYPVYFLYGYADAMGREAEGEDWFSRIDDWAIQYRWWRNR